MPRPLLCSLLGLVIAAAAGCGSEPPAGAKPAEPAAPVNPTAFAPAACGTLTGLVTWVGPVPDVTPVAHISPRADGAGYDTRLIVPANAPRIDRFTRGLAGAVVFLREVETARARPWDLPPVSVEFRDSQIAVIQGDRTGRTGFVRRGGSVSMQSAEPVFHVLRGRGAAFFALPFPEPDMPLARTFDACGRVALSSAAGFYWQSAELFVCDHPYYALTDADGRFHFTQVPAGQYDLVAWHPNWVTTASERSPETGLVTRHVYAPPLEGSRPVVVVAGDVRLATLTLPK